MMAIGGRVIMACRDMEKCAVTRDRIIDKTCNPNVVCQKLDLASMASIREFVDRFRLRLYFVCQVIYIINNYLRY